ncbi:MAG: TlpA disulfide reductase family protein [Actinomycetota bacterium]|nr:TlpA disulfide reductase family protein [Actinomycetota bacterium]
MSLLDGATPGVSGSSPAPLSAPAQRRTVLWVSAAVGLLVAVLVGVLAAVGKPVDTSNLLGSPAPALSGTTLTGHRHLALSDLAGKWVLVDFSASTCVDCREELPSLEVFDRTASRYDAAVLSVEEDPSDASAMARWMTGSGADWPALQDPQASVTWGVTGIPTIFLVDPDGMIVGYYPSGIDPASLDALITGAIRGGSGAP